MTSDLTYDMIDAEQAQPVLGSLIALYLEIYPDPGDQFHGEDRYRRQITSHMAVPGWRAVTCFANGELIGYSYGFPLPPATRWWQGMQTPVADDFTVEDGHRTFAISEIMVKNQWRRRGIARALHDELLADRPELRATLLAEPENAPAQKAYASWGWHKVAELRPHWTDAPLYDVLVLSLSTRSS